MPTSQRRRGAALTSTGCGARTSACVPHASTMGNGLRVSSQDVASCACCWRVAPTAIRLLYDLNTVHAVNVRDDYVAAVALAGASPAVIALHEYADVACTSDIDYRTA